MTTIQLPDDAIEQAARRFYHEFHRLSAEHDAALGFEYDYFPWKNDQLAREFWRGAVKAVVEAGLLRVPETGIRVHYDDRYMAYLDAEGNVYPRVGTTQEIADGSALNPADDPERVPETREETGWTEQRRKDYFDGYEFALANLHQAAVLADAHRLALASSPTPGESSQDVSSEPASDLPRDATQQAGLAGESSQEDVPDSKCDDPDCECHDNDDPTGDALADEVSAGNTTQAEESVYVAIVEGVLGGYLTEGSKVVVSGPGTRVSATIPEPRPDVIREAAERITEALRGIGFEPNEPIMGAAFTVSRASGDSPGWTPAEGDRVFRLNGRCGVGEVLSFVGGMAKVRFSDDGHIDYIDVDNLRPVGDSGGHREGQA